MPSFQELSNEATSSLAMATVRATHPRVFATPRASPSLRARGGTPRAVAAARALDAASSSSDDDAFDAAAHETRLRSYRTADVHIKKAAAKIAGHKKWYADRANSHKKATESCASALEELRLASMVLQRRHDEDSVSSAAAARSAPQTYSRTCPFLGTPSVRTPSE